MSKKGVQRPDGPLCNYAFRFSHLPESLGRNETDQDGEQERKDSGEVPHVAAVGDAVRWICLPQAAFYFVRALVQNFLICVLFINE